MTRWILCTFVLLAHPVAALEIAPAGGNAVAEALSSAASIRLPREAWRPGLVYPETEGAVTRRVYQIPNPSFTTLQLVDPIRSRLQDAGFSVSFSCADAACGGFDFRFQLDLLPAPAMFVDLGNFRYLLMERENGNPKLVSVVASSSSTTSYVHITEVSDIGTQAQARNPESENPSVRRGNASLISTLMETGHAVLDDLEFATGSAELGTGPFESLRILADWLATTPNARIVLVGHTDAIGSLEANLALSRERALSVMSRLISELGAAPEQVTSDGAGALSPIATNRTDEGRSRNRRVEVVLISGN